MNDFAYQIDPTIANSILLSIQEGVTIYDQAFRLVAWNEKYGEMGITPREHIKRGLHIEDTYRYAAEAGVFGPGDPTEITTKRIEQVYAGKSQSVEDLCGVNGEIIEIRRYFLPNIGVAAVFSNVTENRRMSAHVRRGEDLELLARVTSGFCHDFNNVLQAIVANLHVAIELSQLERVEGALAAARNGADLARTMLQLARPNELPEEDSEFNVVEAIDTTVKWMSRVVRDNVTIELDNRVTHAVVRANEGKFAAILANLIVNSHDAMEHGGLICIQVDEHLGNLQVHIVDDGCGMSEDVLRKATAPFFSTKGEHGTGLGAYEAKNFVESLGGRLCLSSVEGVGTTVLIELPVSIEARESISHTRRRNFSGKVLLVEDDPDVQVSMLHFLQSVGCSTISTNCAEAAKAVLSRMDSDYFDLVISDIALVGKIGGTELTNWISKQLPDLPLVLYSGTPVSHELPKGVVFLIKPIDFDVLYEHLDNAMSVK